MSKPFIKLLAAGIVITSFLFACQKEKSGRIELSAEGMNGGSKMYVDGLLSYWQNGDKVNINGQEASITVSGNKAYIDGEFSADNYCIAFPHNILTNRNGSTVTLNMPTTYQYQEDANGHQILNAPMAYYGTAPNGRVLLQHLTGALDITISGGPLNLQIDKIIVSTPDEKKVMNGNMTFNLADIDNISSSATTTSSSRYSLTMSFSDVNFVLTNANPTRTVCVPVPVLDCDVHFQIQVIGHLQGTKYTYTRKQSTGGRLGRGILATVSVNMTPGTYCKTSTRLTSTTVSGISYFNVSSADDLKAMSEILYNNWSMGDYTYSRNANYRLTANINMTNKPIAPIKGLQGIFEGNGKTISNLTINNNYSGNDCHYWGLFINDGSYYHPSSVRNLTINGLTLTGSSSTNGGSYDWLDIGGIVSDASSPYGGTLSISDVIISNLMIIPPNGTSFTEWQVRLGGLAGFVEESVNFVNCSVSFADNQSLQFNCTYVELGGIIGLYIPSASRTGHISTVNVNFNNLIISSRLNGLFSNSWYNDIVNYFSASGTIIEGQVTGQGNKITQGITEMDGVNVTNFNFINGSK